LSRPPRSTLFPYTTLFQSHAAPRTAARPGHPARRVSAPLDRRRGLQEGGGHRWRDRPRRSRPAHAREPASSRPLLVRRGARCVRPHRGLQSPLGLGDRAGGRHRSGGPGNTDRTDRRRMSETEGTAPTEQGPGGPGISVILIIVGAGFVLLGFVWAWDFI